MRAAPHLAAATGTTPPGRPTSLAPVAPRLPSRARPHPQHPRVHRKRSLGCREAAARAR